MFDYDDLQTFVAVADAGGVTPGARRLGLSKSIVSRRLTRLESALKAQLLSRTTRGASLTEAGATFREHAARALAELDAARDALSGDGELQGLLRVAAPLSFGPTHLAPIFAELACRHPRLHVHTSYSDAHVDIVAEGYDAAVRIGYLADSTLVARRIAAVSAWLVASPEYIARRGAPKSLADLADHEALLLRADSWPMTDRGNAVTVNPRGRFRADNGVALTSAALAGLGVALLPDFLADEHIASGALIALLPENRPPPAAIHVVRPPGKCASRKVRVLTEILLARLGEPERAEP